MTIVADASALVDLVTASSVAEAVRIRLAMAPVHVPVTVDAEVVHALRRQWLGGQIEASRVERSLEALQLMVLIRHPVQALVHRMWHLRQNLTAYDAAYVALAESLDAPLVTRDFRLSRSAGHSARIEYVE